MEKLSIANPFDRGPVYYVRETSSTMGDAESLMSLGAPSGTVVVAGFQSAGRGRFESRRWISEQGEGLLFTLLLDHSVLNSRAAMTPLLVGLGVAEFVEKKTAYSSYVKWPNDVVAQDKKVCGILCESRGNTLLVGVGMNCRAPVETDGASENPVQYHLPRISLAELGADETEPLALLPEVLYSLKAAIATAEPIAKINQRLYLRTRCVQVTVGLPDRQEIIDGVLEGLGANGQLLVREQESNRVQEIYSGELSIL